MTQLDETALLADLRAIEPQLRAEAVALRQGAQQLEPYYREIVARAAAVDVGFTRWVGR